MADIKGDESSSAEFDAHFGSGSLKDYQIEKAIGRGHFSVVHRAVRLCDGHRVALKKVQIFDMMDQKARGRCLKEVKLLQTLPPHSAIIQYIDAFIDSNELYIVFEWAEHGDLRRLLRRLRLLLPAVVQQQGGELDRLAKPHLVGEDAGDAILVQVGEPLHTLDLVLAQLAALLH